MTQATRARVIPWAVAGLVVLLLFAHAHHVETHTPGAAPLAPLLAVEEELANQAGTGYPQGLLLNALEAAARTPEERAEVARRRCGMQWRQKGPAAAEAPCRLAVEAARGAGREAVYRAELRLALVELDGQFPVQAAERLARLARPAAPLAAGVHLWAVGRTELALGRPLVAVGVQRAAEGYVLEAVRHDVSKAEFLALAQYRVGEALAAAGQPEEARRMLRAALERQRGLVEQNPEYAEYSHYLGKILRELGHLPGEEAAREEGQRLAEELQRRDPERAEYQAEVRR